MGTRSSITVSTPTGFKTVYCHWDGYPSYNGRLLLTKYNSQEKAEALVELGDISSLRETINCPEGHSFDKADEGCTVFYGRDRGENGTEYKEFPTWEKCLEYNSQEYNYLWDGKQWIVTGYNLDKEPLTESNTVD